jgi:hypothetical protein
MCKMVNHDLFREIQNLLWIIVEMTRISGDIRNSHATTHPTVHLTLLCARCAWMDPTLHQAVVCSAT